MSVLAHLVLRDRTQSPIKDTPRRGHATSACVKIESLPMRKRCKRDQQTLDRWMFVMVFDFQHCTKRQGWNKNTRATIDGNNCKRDHKHSCLHELVPNCRPLSIGYEMRCVLFRSKSKICIAMKLLCKLCAHSIFVLNFAKSSPRHAGGLSRAILPRQWVQTI